ncbi:MAG: sensor histidine kinase [Chloroflexota bacterium]
MGSFFEQFFTLLVTLPGNLVYHLFVVFSIAWALQGSFNHWRASGFPQAFRATLGLMALMGGQLLLLIGALLAQLNLFPAHVVLPPLERLVALFSLLIITWLWAFPEPARLSDSVTLLASLLLTVLTVPAIVSWSSLSGQFAFNDTWYDFAASGVGIAVTGFGSLLLLIRRPNGWGVGLGMLLLLGGGYVAVLTVAYQPGLHYAGVVRLMQLAAYPLLLGLPLRFPVPFETPTPAMQAGPAITLSEKRRYNADPRLIQEFLRLASDSAQGKVCDGLVKAISQMMVADLSFFVSLAENGKQLNVSCGYDLIREKTIEGFTLDERLSPVISSALRRGRAARLPASSTSPDLLGFASVLGVGRVGHLLMVPFPVADKSNLMGIVLLSPYSHRSWSNDDQNNLSQVVALMARILQQKQAPAAGSEELSRTRQALEAARQEVHRLQQEKATPSTETSRSTAAAVIANIGQERFSNSETEQLKEQLRLTLEELARIQAENQQLKLSKTQSTDTNTVEVAQLEDQLRISLEEITRLNERLFEADQRLIEMQRDSQSSAAPQANAELVSAMVQELRQPLFSLAGYTDLLLGESVGILGASQRKFVERVKAAGERLGNLVEDIVHITIDGGLQGAPQENVDLGSAIDEAITASVTQFREKNIALRVDLPEKMPLIQANRDALQQILIHLLQNAGMASPVDGEISLQARIEEGDKDASFVLIRVSDSGEGIPAEELPRVFSRIYRADNPLIPGVGDTGVGLSIVKSLVEAQGGRIWVDAAAGSGSTFSVLLPLATAPASKQSDGNGHTKRVSV